MTNSSSSDGILSLEDYQKLRIEYEQSDSIRHRTEICKRVEQELSKSLVVVNSVWEKFGRKDYFLYEGGVRSLSVITDSYSPLTEQHVLCLVNGEFHRQMAVAWMFGDPKTFWTKHFRDNRERDLADEVRQLESEVEFAEEKIVEWKKNLRDSRKNLIKAKKRLNDFRVESESPED